MTEQTERNEPTCGDASPLTGRKCLNKASIILLNGRVVCARCALRHYRQAPRTWQGGQKQKASP